MRKFDSTDRLASSNIDQLVQFSNFVVEIESLLSSDAQKEHVIDTIKQKRLSPRQESYFLEAVEELYRRRQFVKRTIEVAKEEFPETYAQEIFKTIFSKSGTFRDVTLLEDPHSDAIILLCDSPADVLQTLDLNTDHVQEAAKESIPLDAIEGELSQIPKGVFFRNPRLGEANGAVIVLNNSRLKSEEADESPTRVLKHEQQHARNSLYHRPRLTKFLEASSIPTDVADTIERAQHSLQDITEKIKKAHDEEKSKYNITYLTGDIRQEIYDRLVTEDELKTIVDVVRKTLQECVDNASRVIKNFKKSASESIVKEELLAFYLSDTDFDEINDLLPRYVMFLKEKILKIKTAFEGFVFSVLEERQLTEILRISNPKHRKDFSGFLDVFGVDTSKDQDDEISSSFRQVNKQIDEFDNTVSSLIKEGLSIFKNLENLEEEQRKQLVPILISQPLENWKGLLRDYKNYVVN